MTPPHKKKKAEHIQIKNPQNYFKVHPISCFIYSI